jgi:uncharacterized membrane protein YbhN (UPF0104 family)
MEQENQLQESPLFGLSIDPVIKSHWAETARWGRFLAIVGFVFCGLIAIVGIVMASAFSTLGTNENNDLPPAFGRTFGSAFVVVYLVVAVLYFFPCLFLLRFSNKMRTALAADNQNELTLSFQNLKVMFRYVGILTIIALSLYAIALLFGGLGMMMAR